MSLSSLAQYAVFVVGLVLLARPVGSYLDNVFNRRRTVLDPVLAPVERGMYRLIAAPANTDMDWRTYSLAFVQFTAVSTLVIYLLLRAQASLPLFAPDRQSTPMTVDLAANTAVSFATTTTWQAYAGETTMSYVSQMVGLTSAGFLAGAAGLAVGIAFMRGLAGRTTATLGNFWADIVRAILWVLLPLAIVVALALIASGVPQNLNPYTPVQQLSGEVVALPQGPVATLEVIKNLGTNGGGYFNVNAAHPFANPSPLTNLIALFAIALLPASLTVTFGRIVGRPRQGWVLFWVMLALFVAGLAVATIAEQAGNPALAPLIQPGEAIAALPGGEPGNMEGKEVRFGVPGSVLTAIVTSNGATGSYNAMHDSFLPLGVLVPLVNMLLGEIVFGGLGTGIYSIVMVALVGLFLTGLMIGRTPEYLGKRLGPAEMKLIAGYTIVFPAIILSLTALAISTAAGLAGLTTNDGAHGLTEILYAYATSAANNGQNMAGLSANSPFYNLTTMAAMVVGRFGLGILALALAGRFVAQGARQPSHGAIATDSVLFATVIIGTVLLVTGLCFLPILTLGPIVEHFVLFGQGS